MVQQNWQALADAVKDRREELGLTQPALVERSRHAHSILWPDSNAPRPGLSVRTWSEIERAVKKVRRGETQVLVDASLRWPEGTAKALLYGDERPTGPPAIDDEKAPDEIAPQWQAELESLRVELDELKRRMRVDLLRLELEVAELKASG